MFARNFDLLVDTLLNKLRHFSQSGKNKRPIHQQWAFPQIMYTSWICVLNNAHLLLPDCIDLLTLLPYLEEPASQPKRNAPAQRLELTSFERHLLKGVIPHCIGSAAMRQNVVNDLTGERPAATSAILIDAAPLQPARIPTSVSPMPPRTRTPLNAFSVPGDVIGVPEVRSLVSQ